MSTNVLHCPRCGAEMRIDAEALRATCPVCNTVKKIEPVRADAPRETEGRRALPMPPYALWLLLSGFAAAGIAFPILRAYERHIAPRHTAVDAGPPPSAQVVWDVTRPPILRDLDGDGIEEIVGRFRPDATAGSPMEVGAFDGKTFAPRWTTGPLGDWADGLSSVQLAYTGNALLVSDTHGGAELRDLGSGAVGRKLALPGPASQICAAPDGSVKFWIDTPGGGVFFEPDVPQPTPGPRPDWCAKTVDAGRHAHVLSAASVPKVDGFAPALVLNDGTDAVAVGLVSGLPTLVGFDPDRRVVRWQKPVSLDVQGVRKAAPLGGDLSGGVLVVPYQLASGRRLLAVDAVTGAPRFDVAIPGQGQGDAPWERVLLTPQRVLVPASTGLVVLDAKTGAKLGQIGR